MLYIVATPIGNLGDITVRALDILRSVDVIACEDTRQTLKLLNHYSIAKPLISYYEHNKLSRGQHLVKLLQEGKNVALVSDSGTPGISDPGFHLVRLALENRILVSPLPGPCALIAALSVSGIPSDRFIFEGFLPQKTGPRKRRLQELCAFGKTVVLYESPHRFQRLLHEVASIYPGMELTVIREVTKKFEEIQKGQATQLIAYFSTKPIRGEFVVVINTKGENAGHAR